MFPPPELWDQLPRWYADWLRKNEADLPRMQAELDALPRVTSEQVAKLRFLFHGTTGTSEGRPRNRETARTPAGVTASVTHMDAAGPAPPDPAADTMTAAPLRKGNDRHDYNPAA